ncbi:MAG: hypothetical protein MUO73_02000 [Thermoplasmata archaeon]|nr:hypothetical protein [Thermoplasmata archaeon]
MKRMPDKKPRSVHPREKLPGKCNRPIWVTDTVHGRMSERAENHYRTRGRELEAMLDELDGKDKIVPTNVPVLQEKKA